MLLTASIVKAICEIALMALLGQGVLTLIAGKSRVENPIYQLLVVVTRPFTWLTRKIMPRWVLSQHIPAATFFVLACLWSLSLIAKVKVCLAQGGCGV